VILRFCCCALQRLQPKRGVWATQKVRQSTVVTEQKMRLNALSWTHHTIKASEPVQQIQTINCIRIGTRFVHDGLCNAGVETTSGKHAQVHCKRLLEESESLMLLHSDVAVAQLLLPKELEINARTI